MKHFPEFTAAVVVCRLLTVTTLGLGEELTPTRQPGDGTPRDTRRLNRMQVTHTDTQDVCKCVVVFVMLHLLVVVFL